MRETRVGSLGLEDFEKGNGNPLIIPVWEIMDRGAWAIVRGPYKESYTT